MKDRYGEGEIPNEAKTGRLSWYTCYTNLRSPNTNADTGTNTYTNKQSGEGGFISFKPHQQQEVTEAQPEENPTKTHEIDGSADNTNTSLSQSEPSPTSESENHTDQQRLPPSSPIILTSNEWRECSFPFDEVRNGSSLKRRAKLAVILQAWSEH